VTEVRLVEGLLDEALGGGVREVEDGARGGGQREAAAGGAVGRVHHRLMNRQSARRPPVRGDRQMDPRALGGEQESQQLGGVDMGQHGVLTSEQQRTDGPASMSEGGVTHGVHARRPAVQPLLRHPP
jgi:hypothetical protein